MPLRSSDTIPDLEPAPTRRLPAMADWTQERADVGREPATAVWEEAPKTVVETPWWLQREGGEGTRRETPRSLGIAPPPRADRDAMPLVFASVFEVDEPTIQRFPRTPTRYDLEVMDGSHLDEPTDEVVPLPSSTRCPRRRRPPRPWSLMLLVTLAAAALGSLAGVCARLVELLPR